MIDFRRLGRLCFLFCKSSAENPPKYKIEETIQTFPPPWRSAFEFRGGIKRPRLEVWSEKIPKNWPFVGLMTTIGVGELSKVNRFANLLNKIPGVGPTLDVLSFMFYLLDVGQHGSKPTLFPGLKKPKKIESNYLEQNPLFPDIPVSRE